MATEAVLTMFILKCVLCQETFWEGESADSVMLKQASQRHYGSHTIDQWLEKVFSLQTELSVANKKAESAYDEGYRSGIEAGPYSDDG